MRLSPSLVCSALLDTACPNSGNNLLDKSLTQLQEVFHQQSLPAVKDPITFELGSAPYMCRSGVADCYLFHVTGERLSALYEKHGEGLLQRNIRVDQRDTATNRSIEETSCISTTVSRFCVIAPITMRSSTF
jgi:hypothetical protein